MIALEKYVMLFNTFHLTNQNRGNTGCIQDAVVYDLLLYKIVWQP